MTRKKAFVTGASRGIGKAIALRLAQGGFDVALTARSLEDGELREHSSTMKRSDVSPLPGGLQVTAEQVRQTGADALVVQADLLDHASLERAADQALQTWSRMDVVVHAGRFIGPGLKDQTLETPIDVLEKHIQANAIAPAVLNRRFIPAMLSEGEGAIIYVTSTAAYRRPFATVDKGGWGLSYAMSKAAGHAAIGVLYREYGPKGLRAFNLQPGAILTERIAMEMPQSGMDNLFAWEPVEVPAEVAFWLATSSEAAALNGTCIEAQELCRERNLLPDWKPRAKIGG
jgi:NAD(P)-dependent dehydrogenase (short-subunit alcohol dehydrogenase family)